MSSSVHTVKAETLREGDRLLLKDLRVLTVSSKPVVWAGGKIHVKFDDFAQKDRGSFDLEPDQKVRVICSGWCAIDQALADLL